VRVLAPLFEALFAPSAISLPSSHEKPMHPTNKELLGAGLEPACLSAYAPQTYVSAIPPPEPCARASNFPAYSNGLQVAVASMKSTEPWLKFMDRARA
jgi:hypothetical protein